jgi:DNA-binding NarL/FixJ family response regulator
MIRVQIIDDFPTIVETLERLINGAGDMQLVGKACSAAEGRTMLAADLPDVLLLDISLPDGDGGELCAELSAKYPTLKIVMFTSYVAVSLINNCLQNGATGYLLKSASLDDIFAAIRAAAAGRQYLCHEADALMNT